MRICKNCGAHLDPCERCDCEDDLSEWENQLLTCGNCGIAINIPVSVAEIMRVKLVCANCGNVIEALISQRTCHVATGYLLNAGKNNAHNKTQLAF